jgi:hypothetical protein
MVPTDMATARIGDRDFIVLGSDANAGESGAISVMELRDSGALLPVDHVIDTLARGSETSWRSMRWRWTGAPMSSPRAGTGVSRCSPCCRTGACTCWTDLTGDETGLGATSRRWKLVGRRTLRVFATTEEEAGIAVLHGFARRTRD